MGGITRQLFGGSKTKSDNKAYGTLLGALQGNLGQGNSAMSTLGSFLGIGDPAAGKAGFQNYLDSTGYNSLLESGSKAITGNAASKGLLRSGATAKALTGFGQDLAQQKTDSYLQQLTGLGNYGIQSAQVIGQAGQRSKGTESKGAFNALFPGGLSDRRLKHKLEAIGENEQGITIYRFEFKHLPGQPQVGVMADEVAEKLPDALGPDNGDYRTVDYGMIKPVFGLPAFTIVTEAPEYV